MDPLKPHPVQPAKGGWVASVGGVGGWVGGVGGWVASVGGRVASVGGRVSGVGGRVGGRAGGQAGGRLEWLCKAGCSFGNWVPLQLNIRIQHNSNIALLPGLFTPPMPVPACPQECGLLAALRHPNVVQFMGVSAMPPAMITEYCSRGSLADVLHAANRSSARAAQLTWARRLNLVSCQGWGLQGRGQGQEGHA